MGYNRITNLKIANKFNELQGFGDSSSRHHLISAHEYARQRLEKALPGHGVAANFAACNMGISAIAFLAHALLANGVID